MKNIHKIIESPIEIKDKCSWWLDTNTNILYRWDDVTEAWVTITSPAEAIEETDPQFLAWKEAPIRKDNILAALDEEVPNPTTKYLNGNRKWVEAVGLKGDIGPQGPPGAKVSVISTTTLEPGNPASVVNQSLEEGVAELIFSIPKGEKGDPGATTGVIGETGPAGTIQIASTETLPAGSDAYIETTGSPSASVLKFFIPEGALGPRGLKGEKGDPGSGGGGIDNLAAAAILILYADLVDLRDRGSLVPGRWYQIIDYTTYAFSEITPCESKEEPFDILVLATSTYTLSEDAKAIKHVDKHYFADSNLAAWKLSYTLDENKDIHEWAGRGWNIEEGIGTGLITPSSRWWSIAHGGGSTVAVGLYGRITYSLNGGMSWVDANVNSTYSLRHVFYVGGRFIAPVYGTNICLISYDLGITFEEKILPGTGRWLRGAYGYNTIVLVGGYSGAPSDDAEFLIIYSNDLGETWLVASYPGVRVGWINIIFGDGKFIIMPPGNTATAVDFLVSYNGIDWEIKLIPPYMTTYYMVYGNGIIITTNNSNTIWRSEDGLMWSSITVPNVQFRQIIYGNGIFVASTYGTSVLISKDGLTWESHIIAMDAYYEILGFGAGRFTIIANDSTKVMYSLDGIIWKNVLGAYSIKTLSPGKGVIYQMLDEFDNNLPYDFKNIKTLRNLGDGNKFYYTFSILNNNIISDATIIKGKVLLNNMLSRHNKAQQILNDNIVTSTTITNDTSIIANKFSFNVCGNTFADNLKNCEIESNVKNQNFTAITGMYNKDYTIRVVNANTGNPIITALDASGVNVLITT